MKARAPAIAPKAKSPSRRYFAALESLEPRLLLSSTPTPAQTIAQSDNQFAFDLFQPARSTSAGDNVFFSPYSIATALEMTLQGANGQTAAQMVQALHLPDADVAQAGIQALYQLFQASPSTAGYTLSTANRLWVKHNFQLLQSFLDSEQSTSAPPRNPSIFPTQMPPPPPSINGSPTKPTAKSRTSSPPPRSMISPA